MKQNHTQFLIMLEDTFQRIRDLTASKGEEYAGDQTDVNQHKNFDDQAQELSMLPEQIWLVMFNKHLSSIKTYIKRLAIAVPGKAVVVASEPITGRIDDAILYLLLLKGMYMRRNDYEAKTMEISALASRADRIRDVYNGIVSDPEYVGKKDGYKIPDSQYWGGIDEVA